MIQNGAFDDHFNDLEKQQQQQQTTTTISRRSGGGGGASLLASAEEEEKKNQGAPRSRCCSLPLDAVREKKHSLFMGRERAASALDFDPMMRVSISFIALVALATVGWLVPGENSEQRLRKFAMHIVIAASQSNSWQTCGFAIFVFSVPHARCSLCEFDDMRV